MPRRAARPSDDSPGRPSPLPARRLLAASVAIAMVGVPAALVAPAAVAAPDETTSSAAAEPAVIEQPAAAPYEEPVAEEPVAEEPAAEEPVAEEPVAEEPVAEEPAAEEPATGEPAVEEPASEEPAEQPSSGETPAEVPAPGDPTELPEAEPGTLTLVTPTGGTEFDPAGAMFAGTGITAFDTIAITYQDADGDTTTANSTALPAIVGTDLTWSAPVSFGELADDQTEVEVTITELDGESAVVGAPITVSITVVEVAAPVYPYTVTLPEEGATVDTYTPALTGTSAPGEAMLVTVLNEGDTVPVIVGTALADTAGVFSTVLDLGKVVQDDDGETDVTIDVTRVGADGTIVADNLRSVDIVFAPGGEPFEPNAPGIILLPEQITVSDATNPLKGVLISATGFEQNEDVEVVVTAPGGATIVFDEDALEALGGADETGTFEAPLFLFGETPLGMYTVTVNGVDSDVSVTGSFELIADPAPVTPPTVPADNGTVTPVDNTPTDDGSDHGWADDELAHTGTDSAPLAGIAAALLLAGAALVLFRRRSRAFAI